MIVWTPTVRIRSQALIPARQTTDPLFSVWFRVWFSSGPDRGGLLSISVPVPSRPRGQLAIFIFLCYLGLALSPYLFLSICRPNLRWQHSFRWCLMFVASLFLLILCSFVFPVWDLQFSSKKGFQTPGCKGKSAATYLLTPSLRTPSRSFASFCYFCLRDQRASLLCRVRRLKRRAQLLAPDSHLLLILFVFRDDPWLFSTEKKTKC